LIIPLCCRVLLGRVLTFSRAYSLTDKILIYEINANGSNPFNRTMLLNEIIQSFRANKTHVILRYSRSNLSKVVFLTDKRYVAGFEVHGNLIVVNNSAINPRSFSSINEKTTYPLGSSKIKKSNAQYTNTHMANLFFQSKMSHGKLLFALR
jgi:hypothetical protein